MAETKIRTHDEGKQRVQSQTLLDAPIFPKRSRRTTKLTVPVRPIVRAPPGEKLAEREDVPQPVVRKKKRQSTAHELVAKNSLVKRPVKNYKNNIPTIEEKQETIYVENKTLRLYDKSNYVENSVKKVLGDKVCVNVPEQNYNNKDVKNEFKVDSEIRNCKSLVLQTKAKKDITEDTINSLGKNATSTENKIEKVSAIVKPQKVVNTDIKSESLETKSEAFLKNKGNTLKSFTSDDYSDYQWFDAADEKLSDFVDCSSSCYESFDGKLLKCVAKETKNVLLNRNTGNISLSNNHEQTQIMNHFDNDNVLKSQKNENRLSLTNPDQINEPSGEKVENGLQTVTSSGSTRKEKTSSGFFSFLRWFRKSKEEESDEGENKEFEEGLNFPTTPSTPELIHSHSSSCGSIDTLFSTATATSFAFIAPTYYKPIQSERKINISPDTDTYRKRLHYRDRVRELDKNITLRRKYNLHRSDGVLSAESSPTQENKLASNAQDEKTQENKSTYSDFQNFSFGRRKRKAPPPPVGPIQYKLGDSLPNTLDGKCKSNKRIMENEAATGKVQLHHRRTYSESAKDRKSGAYCHVKGKRKAPQPPTVSNDLEKANESDLFDSIHNPFPSFGKKKRPAPQPPYHNDKDINETVPLAKENINNNLIKIEDSKEQSSNKLSNEEKERLIANIAKLKAHADRKSLLATPPSSPSKMELGFKFPHEQVVCNDSLKLERGVLKPNKDLPKIDLVETKIAPVSPRPWYKRNIMTKENSTGMIKKDLFKSLEKKKEGKVNNENWMPEVGIPRGSKPFSNDGSSCRNSKFLFFSKGDKGEEKKKEGEKRKSQLFMLANISELDREAAEIVQREQEREKALLSAEDEKFYLHSDIVPARNLDVIDVDLDLPNNSNVEVPKRSSTKELISLFNAIGNVTKVTVNTNFFSKDGSKLFSKETNEKRFSFVSEKTKEADEERPLNENISFQQEKSNVKQSILANYKQKSKIPEESSVTSGINKNSGVCRENENISDKKHAPSDLQPEDSSKASEMKNEIVSNKSLLVEENRKIHYSPKKEISPIKEQSESAVSTITNTGLENVIKTVNFDNTEMVDKVLPTVHNHHKPPEPLVQAKQLTIWSCPRCTLENPCWKLMCDACGRWRPSHIEEKVEPFSRKETLLKPTAPLASPDATIDLTENNLPDNKKSINWESEIKKYFPSKDIPFNNNVDIIGTDKKEEPNKKKSDFLLVSEYEQKRSKSDISKCSSNVNNETNNLPATFIGGKLKQDKVKVKDELALKNDPSQNNVSVNFDTVKEPNVDEVRKARLAFFNKESHECNGLNEVEPYVNNEQDINDKIAPEENDQQKLREMLKEMKNSLPKRSKQIRKSDSKITAEETLLANNILINESNDAVAKTFSTELQEQSSKHGAIKKVLKQKTETQKLKNGITNSSHLPTSVANGTTDKVSAIFITEKVRVEETKVRRSNLSKPTKVSTSVQTSSVIKKLEPSSLKNQVSISKDKHSAGQPPHTTYLPVTVLEYSDTDKGFVLCTSSNKEGRKIGTGTFELIRPKDFATIEATKTGNECNMSHVYANISRDKPDIKSQQILFDAQDGASSSNKTELKCEDNKTGNDVLRNYSTSHVHKCPDSALACKQDRLSNNSASQSTNGSSDDNSEVERLTAQLTLPKGLAEFKADLQATPPAKNINTLAINRLLRRLEAAIAGGQHIQAAGLAKELARLKINCSVIRQRRSFDSSPASITVDMYVEDKVSHQGPIPLQVTPAMTVMELKEKVEQEFEIPVGVQRWILGKLLASDDLKTLEEHNISASGCPMFLYLVAPDGDKDEEISTVVELGTTAEIEDKKDELPKNAQQAPPEKPGGGWYYNDEEDHYSFCEDTTSELSDQEDEKTKENLLDKGDKNAVTVVNKNENENVKCEKKEETDEEEIYEEEIDDDDDDEEEEEEADDEESDTDESGVGATAIIHEPPAVLNGPPLSLAQVLDTKEDISRKSKLETRAASTNNDAEIIKTIIEAKEASRKQGLKVKNDIIVNDENKENIKTPALTGTLKFGWKCPVCTLVNPPTRPGCAACTTERPLNYTIPLDYHANEQELQRLQQEQQLDKELAQANERENTEKTENQKKHYLELVDLENTELVTNIEVFDCPVCMDICEPGNGVVLRDCIHSFCRTCLRNTIQFSEEAEVKCPYRDTHYACDSVLQEREIKALVTKEVYEQHLAKSVAQAENKIENAFHCKTPDCRGWCIYEDNVNEFRCPVCKRINCLTCQAIHEGLNCKQYQEQMKQESETNVDARRTREMLEEMVDRGEAMVCPTCQVVLMKKWGCDWLRCSMCKTEICWVTRGPRWGPGGKGDTTGGCQCGVNGVKCHPRCNYCH